MKKLFITIAFMISANSYALSFVYHGVKCSCSDAECEQTDIPYESRIEIVSGGGQTYILRLSGGMPLIAPSISGKIVPACIYPGFGEKTFYPDLLPTTKTATEAIGIFNAPHLTIVHNEMYSSKTAGIQNGDEIDKIEIKSSWFNIYLQTYLFVYNDKDKTLTLDLSSTSGGSIFASGTRNMLSGEYTLDEYLDQRSPTIYLNKTGTEFKYYLEE